MKLFTVLRAERLVVPAILAVLVGLHLDAMRTNYNDKATHLAMVYHCRYGDAEGAAITDRLREAWGDGDPLDRLSYCSSYPLPNALTLALDRLPHATAFQSVFLAHLFLHLAATLLALAALRVSLGAGLRDLSFALLVSLLPWVTLAPWSFPYANEFFGWHSWRTSYPRGAAVLLTMVAAAVLVGRQSGGAAPRTRYLISAGTLLLAGSMHWQMAVMSAAVLGIVFFIPRLLRTRGFLDRDEDWRRLQRRGLVLSAAILGVKLAALVGHLTMNRDVPIDGIWDSWGVRAIATVGVGFAIFYCLASLWLIKVWRSHRSRVPEQRREFGDAVAAVLAGMAFVVLGSYPLSPTSHEWVDGVTILLYEPTRRIIAIGHLAWFVLAWFVFRARFRASPHRAVRPWILLFAATGALALAYGTVRDTEARATVMSRDLLEITLDDVSGKTMRQPDDYRVYHAIANEYRRLLR